MRFWKAAAFLQGRQTSVKYRGLWAAVNCIIFLQERSKLRIKGVLVSFLRWTKKLSSQCIYLTYDKRDSSQDFDGGYSTPSSFRWGRLPPRRSRRVQGVAFRGAAPYAPARVSANVLPVDPVDEKGYGDKSCPFSSRLEWAFSWRNWLGMLEHWW